MKNEKPKKHKGDNIQEVQVYDVSRTKKKKSRVWRNNTDEEKVVGEVGKK